MTDEISPVFTGFTEQLEVNYGETIKLSDQESEGVIYAAAEDEISDTAVYISNVQPVPLRIVKRFTSQTPVLNITVAPAVI